MSEDKLRGELSFDVKYCLSQVVNDVTGYHALLALLGCGKVAGKAMDIHTHPGAGIG